MRVDTYTKAVLTVIAACLVWLCIGQRAMPVSADAPQEVIVVGVRGTVPVVTAPRTSLMVRPTGDWYENGLPIVSSNPLPIRITGVEKGAAKWDPLDVNIKEGGRKPTPGH